MSVIGVTVIVTAHHESEMLIPAIESLLQASSRLEQSGVEIQKLLVCDKADAATQRVAESYATKNLLEVISVEFGDQGKTRNYCVLCAKGEFVAFLDGDDLWSENWLFEAYRVAKLSGQRSVVYPEFNWYFEGSENILCKIDSNNKWFDAEALRGVNLWDALCFSPKDVYEEIPFLNRELRQGFAYEDWNWNRRVLEAGIKQVVATDTIIFKRRRVGSQGAEALRRGVIARPTESSFYDYWDNPTDEYS